MDESDDREVRAARNQAVMRAVNEKIADLNAAFGALAGSYSIACECSDNGCITMLEVPPDAYHTVRRNPRMFVVFPDHVQPDVESVVSRHDGYAVVEVIGRGVEVAEAAYRAEGASTGGTGGL